MSSETGDKVPRRGIKWRNCDRCEIPWPLHDMVERDGFLYCKRRSCLDDLNPIDFVQRI